MMQPNYAYCPDITVSEKLNAVLSETSWLASADDIANGIDEQALTELCSPPKQ